MSAPTGRSATGPATGTPAAADDVGCWQQLRLGDESAMASLFERHADAVFGFAFRRLARRVAAEDVTQQTFAGVWQRARAGRLEALRLPSALPYLITVATHECANQVRGDRRRDKLARRLRLVEDQPDHADAVAGRLDDERRMADLRVLLASLPRTQRETFELVVWAELSIDQAAVALGVAPGTVKSRLSRGRRGLARLLDTDNEEF